MLHNLQPFDVVPYWDPAIDRDRTNLFQYTKDRDTSALVMRSGKAPQTFVCRPISNRMAIDVLMAEPNANVRRRRAFQLSVTMVRNASLTDGRDGVQWRPRAVDDAGATSGDLSGLADIVSDDELELFDATTIMEVGEVALSRAFLPRGIVASYVLPPMSLALLEVSADLYAAVARNAPAGTSTGSGAPATVSVRGNGAQGGAATAKASDGAASS